MALTPGCANQLWHFHAPSSGIAAYTKMWCLRLPPVPPAHWGQREPPDPCVCCRQQSPALAHQHPTSMVPVKSFHRKPTKSSCPQPLTGAVGPCSIPEATAHSAGTCTTALTPNPPPGPSPPVALPQAAGPVELGCREVCAHSPTLFSRHWELGSCRGRFHRHQ